MNAETLYQEALELTHRMLACARAQDWDALTPLGEQRLATVEAAIGQHGYLSSTEKQRLSEIISEIERESAEIIERVECWQEHVRILLRMNKPTS